MLHKTSDIEKLACSRLDIFFLDSRPLHVSMHFRRHTNFFALLFLTQNTHTHTRYLLPSYLHHIIVHLCSLDCKCSVDRFIIGIILKRPNFSDFCQRWLVSTWGKSFDARLVLLWLFANVFHSSCPHLI